MGKYIGKRILMMIPVLLGITLLIFSIMEIAPGETAELILGDGATEEAIMELEEAMGLNQPFIVRYFRYLFGLIRGDLGTSYRTGVPVIEEIIARFPHTFKLAFLGVWLSVMIAVPIGVISAVKQYSLVDNLSMLLALVLTSMPGFWLGMMLILLFSVRLGWFPATAMGSWRDYILPVATVAFVSMSTLTRMTRSTMLETIRQDYVRTARSKGAKESQVIIRHALRNALLPLITVIGNNFGHQLGGTVMIETVFAINGLGYYVVQAIRMKDTPVVVSTLLVVCFLASIVNLIVDILYAFVDPRIRSQYVKIKEKVNEDKESEESAA